MARLDELPADDISTSIVSFHEQVLGWQAFIHKARKPEQIVLAYSKLEGLWRSFLRMNVASFTAEAQARFGEVWAQCPRVQTMDLRIASVALVTNSTLLSRNLRDFRRVPGLLVENGRCDSGLTMSVMIECRDEKLQVELLGRFQAEGLDCRALVG